MFIYFSEKVNTKQERVLHLIKTNSVIMLGTTKI